MAYEINVEKLENQVGSIAIITTDTIEEFGTAIDKIQSEWPQWVYFGGVGIGSKFMIRGVVPQSLDTDPVIIDDKIIFEDNHGFSPIRINGRWSMKLFLWPVV